MRRKDKIELKKIRIRDCYISLTRCDKLIEKERTKILLLQEKQRHKMTNKMIRNSTFKRTSPRNQKSLSTPQQPTSKIIRKSKSPTEILTTKRTPKPNRRYVNEETVNTLKKQMLSTRSTDISSYEEDDDDGDDYINNIKYNTSDEEYPSPLEQSSLSIGVGSSKVKNVTPKDRPKKSAITTTSSLPTSPPTPTSSNNKSNNNINKNTPLQAALRNAAAAVASASTASKRKFMPHIDQQNLSKRVIHLFFLIHF